MKPLMSVAVALLVWGTACQPSRSTARGSSDGPRAVSALSDTVASLEDRRSFGGGELLNLALSATEPEVRVRALRALGRIQDPAAAEVLAASLRDRCAVVRGEAAFALGLLGLSWEPLDESVTSALTNALLLAEAAERDQGPKLDMLEAIGRVGTAPGLERLVVRLSDRAEVSARAALSLGIAAKRGAAIPPSAVSALEALIGKERPESLRFAAAYALAISKSDAGRIGLLACAGDEASEIRAVCARGLGELGSEAEVQVLAKLLEDSDYRVVVEATRSLAKQAGRCKAAVCPPLSALGGLSRQVQRLLTGDTAGGAQPLLALAQVGLPPSGRPLLERLRAELSQGLGRLDAQGRRSDVALIECRFAAALDKQLGAVKQVASCGANLVPETLRLSIGLSEVGGLPAGDQNARVASVSPYLQHRDARVRIAALRALGETKSPAGRDAVRPFLAHPDLTLAAAAATAASQLGDVRAGGEIRALAKRARDLPDIAPSLAEALAALDAKDAIPELERYLGSTHHSVRAAGAAALTKLRGAPVAAPRVERPVEGSAPARLPRDAALLIKTAKGDLEVRLLVDEAPRTAQNMHLLALRGFFSGLTFHRVVPDFVVQGGDPRGDGEGGPGHTIRCEVNRQPYRRGVVGMALSGKDTGGSQFFITTSRQPHLDGRYTAFGVVVRGLEVADALLEGDEILEIRPIRVP